MTPYENGAAAYRAGRPIIANPYRGKASLAEESRLWNAGWYDAKHTAKRL